MLGVNEEVGELASKPYYSSRGKSKRFTVHV